MWWTFDSSQVFFPSVPPPVCLCLLKLHLKSLLIFISIGCSALPVIDQRDDADTLQRLQIHLTFRKTCTLFDLIYKHEAHLTYSCMFLPHMSCCFSFSLQTLFAHVNFDFFHVLNFLAMWKNNDYIRNKPTCIECAELWTHLSQVLSFHLARNKCAKHAEHQIKQTKQLEKEIFITCEQ